MTQYINWNTGLRGPTAPDSVTLFAHSSDAKTCAEGVRAQFKDAGIKGTVRIIPRTVRVARAGLDVYAVVIKREAK
jgi:hypothetical protein